MDSALSRLGSFFVRLSERRNGADVKALVVARALPKAGAESKPASGTKVLRKRERQAPHRTPDAITLEAAMALFSEK